MKDTIKEYLAGQYDAYVKDLETLTNIDSGNGDLQGTEADFSPEGKRKIEYSACCTC